MDKAIKEILWNQFGASIDMLINVISNSPDDYFITHKRFYYIAFHSTLTGSSIKQCVTWTFKSFQFETEIVYKSKPQA